MQNAAGTGERRMGTIDLRVVWALMDILECMR